MAEHDVTADVVVRRGVRVSGLVRSAPGAAPVGGARVELEQWGELLAVTDAMGRFELGSVPPRGTTVRVSAPGHNARLFSISVANLAAPLLVELTPLAPDAGVKTELTGIGAVLRGRGEALVIGEVLRTRSTATLRPG